MRFIVTACQVGDVTQAPALLKGQVGNAVLAEKASDSNALRETIVGMGVKVVIATDRSRKTIIPHNKFVYRYRNCIERCVNRIKHFPRFATH